MSPGMADDAFERAMGAGAGGTPAQLRPALTAAELESEERHHAFASAVGENGSGPRSLDALGYVDLAPILAGGVEPERPTLVPVGDSAVFYRSRESTLYGPPGHGKSLFVEWAGAGALLAGRGVVFLDYEDTAATILERLQRFGVPPEVLADPSRFVYLRPEAKLTPAAVGCIRAAAHYCSADYVAFDAIGPAMATHGLDESSNRDYQQWHASVVRPLTGHPWAVLLVDHPGKNPEAAASGRGAYSKVQLSSLYLQAKLVQPFSRTRPGSFKLVNRKDRAGNFAPGETVALVRVDPDAEPMIVVDPPADTDTEPGEWRPTGLMERLSRALEAATTRADETDADLPSREEALALITGKATYRRQALDALVTEDYAERHRDGRSYRYRSTRPYRETGPS